ncbi:MAG: CHAD domain-containing protein [Sciscionella sp.]
MTTLTKEIERKYEIGDGGEVPTLSDLAGVATESGLQVLELEATYFDTVDLRLARDRITLRRRVGGTDAGWHLKLPVGKDSRDELYAPLGESITPPAELVVMVQARIRGAALVPVARIDTVRHRRALLNREGRLLAEVVDDRVSASDLGTRPGMSGESTVECWREVEVELGEGGGTELLDLVEARLAEVGARTCRAGSKLRRVLAARLSEPVTRPRTGRRASALDAVLAYVHTQVEKLKLYDPLARRDTPDAVHQLRVAVRRTRSALQAFGEVLDRKRTRELTDELRWLSGELGAARDLEVLRERFESVVGALPAELVIGPVPARLARHFARAETMAQDTVRVVLDEPRYFALLDKVEALLSDPPAGARARTPARKQLPRAVRRAYRRVRNRILLAESLPPGTERETALHETRKAAKRLRYASEIAMPAVGKPARRFRRDVKALQQLLGEHQDSVLARPVLRELGMQAHLKGENGFTFGLLYGRELDRAAELAAEAVPAWAKLGKRKRCAWFT